MPGESQVLPPSAPDPTVMTTEQLDRAINGVRELFDARLEGVALQFGLVERQRVEQKEDTKAAVDAALTAQKEAVKEQTSASERAIAKSEAATSKQLEQLSATFLTAINGVTISLSDLKDRVGRIESIKAGGQQAFAAGYVLAGLLIAIAGIAISIALR